MEISEKSESLKKIRNFWKIKISEKIKKFHQKYGMQSWHKYTGGGWKKGINDFYEIASSAERAQVGHARLAEIRPHFLKIAPHYKKRKILEEKEIP